MYNIVYSELLNTSKTILKTTTTKLGISAVTPNTNETIYKTTTAELSITETARKITDIC